MFDYEVAIAKKLIPDLKVIFVIRNPVDRMISQITRQWTYAHVDKGASTNRNLFALLRQVDSSLSRRLNDFSESYRIWHSNFGSKNLLVKTYDDLVDNPAGFAFSLASFLDIDSAYLLSSKLLRDKPNSSKYKSEIPDFLYWYLAVEWLPMVRKLDKQIESIQLDTWIQKMTEIKSNRKWHWSLIRWIHKAYFCFPYTILYSVFNFFRSIIRKSINNKIIHGMVS